MFCLIYFFLLPPPRYCLIFQAMSFLTPLLFIKISSDWKTYPEESERMTGPTVGYIGNSLGTTGVIDLSCLHLVLKA